MNLLNTVSRRVTCKRDRNVSVSKSSPAILFNSLLDQLRRQANILLLMHPLTIQRANSRYYFANSKTSHCLKKHSSAMPHSIALSAKHTLRSKDSLHRKSLYKLEKHAKNAFPGQRLSNANTVIPPGTLDGARHSSFRSPYDRLFCQIC